MIGGSEPASPGADPGLGWQHTEPLPAPLWAILITAVGFNWTGYGFGWTLRGTAQQMVIDAAVAAPISVPVDSLQMMMNARDLRTQRYQDFSVVFDERSWS
jgi:hypothetical protein